MEDIERQDDFRDRYTLCASESAKQSDDKPITKLSLFLYGILFELYVGFRLVFAFPERYPQFEWLFDALRALNAYRKVYIDYLCSDGNYLHVFIVAGVISASAMLRARPYSKNLNSKKEAR